MGLGVVRTAVRLAAAAAASVVANTVTLSGGTGAADVGAAFVVTAAPIVALREIVTAGGAAEVAAEVSLKVPL